MALSAAATTIAATPAAANRPTILGLSFGIVSGLAC
jgi:hypothetical protein